jgi:hypothetical protein
MGTSIDTTTTIEPTTIELLEDEVVAVRDALAQEMVTTCKVIKGHVNEHLGGSNVGLCDARHWIGELAELADVMDKLDPPGWAKTLGPKAQEGGEEG